MNDSRALPPNPCAPPHGRICTSLSFVPFLPPSPPFPLRHPFSLPSAPVEGVADCRVEEFTITRNVFIGFGRASLSCLSFSPFFRSPFRGGSSSNRWRSSSPPSRSFLFVLFFLFFSFFSHLFARTYSRTSLKEGSRATENIEFRPTPEVTRQTNGKPSRPASRPAGRLPGCVVLLNRVYRITARFISESEYGARALSLSRTEEKKAARQRACFFSLKSFIRPPGY